MKQSAGTLLYSRLTAGPADDVGSGLEVLLVHPSGNYNRGKPWSIPKGIPDSGEDLEAAARRETLEETGVIAGDLAPLGEIRYRKSAKQIYCFAGPAPQGAAPCCNSWEVDRAEFVPFEQARTLIHPDQAVFLDRLVELLRKRG